MMIFHLASESDWAANDGATYAPAAFDDEGFVHCASAEQLPGVVERYYEGRTDVFELTIDPDRLEPELVWENTSGGTELFPHIYGRINLDAIVERTPFPT